MVFQHVNAYGRHICQIYQKIGKADKEHERHDPTIVLPTVTKVHHFFRLKLEVCRPSYILVPGT